MQVQNRALQGGLVFTRWLWFLGPIHGVGMIWTAAFVLAVLRITTATLVSTWYATFGSSHPAAICYSCS